ncbi:MAG: hypothetical protein WCI18_02250 [Pseudomonadota bacterium]
MDVSHCMKSSGISNSILEWTIAKKVQKPTAAKSNFVVKEIYLRTHSRAKIRVFGAT